METGSQKIRQETALRQHQALSPQQVRYFRLLEMNDRQVDQEVQHELEENPALEVAEPQEGLPENDFKETAQELQDADYTSEDDIPFTAPGHILRQSPSDWDPVVTAAEPEATMYDTLKSQLGLLDLSEREHVLAERIIGSLESSGYLTRSSVDIADDAVADGLTGVTPGEVRTVLRKVQQLDPPGIAAVDLHDCLRLQLQRVNPKSEAVEDALEIVSHWFDLFTKRNFKRLEIETGLSRERLQSALAVITHLTPKPGSLFADSDNPLASGDIIPDFELTTEDDDITLTMPSSIPELQIEKQFLGEDSPIPEVETFVRNQRNMAQGFIDILAMRRRTLWRVVSAIVQLQRRFFLTGNTADLRPMILRDVQRVTGDDLSVISRATNGKYIATDHGTYPLKYFFNEGFSGSADGSSSRHVANRIRTIIEKEDPHKPLTDQEIAALLTKEGINAARRTIAKYREQMGIPPSRMRKQI